ncbi:MAG: metalloregulator ArsR/SmtB family transcription factor [Bacteroidetes bacterium]|nr:metalloregulator ArsR/SmtB family transcription factor [Bacteroidota bacterium]
MAEHKKHLFDKDEIDIAEVAKALSHPARLKILRILSQMNVCMCGEIVDLLPLAQATVSQHLKELKRVNLIQGEIEGPKTCYCIDTGSIQKIFEKFQNYFNEINRESNRSCKTKKK